MATRPLPFPDPGKGKHRDKEATVDDLLELLAKHRPHTAGKVSYFDNAWQRCSVRPGQWERLGRTVGEIEDYLAQNPRTSEDDHNDYLKGVFGKK